MIKFKKFTVCMFNLRIIHHHQKIDREQTNKSHLSQQQLHLRNTSIQTIQTIKKTPITDKEQYNSFLVTTDSSLFESTDKRRSIGRRETSVSLR